MQVIKCEECGMSCEEGWHYLAHVRSHLARIGVDTSGFLQAMQAATVSLEKFGRAFQDVGAQAAVSMRELQRAIGDRDVSTDAFKVVANDPSRFVVVIERTAPPWKPRRAMALSGITIGPKIARDESA